MINADIYTALAPLYDVLMADVDYDAWADYIDEILQMHHPAAEQILELACGTGSLALSLEEFGYYKITGTDLSQHMIDLARQKAEQTGSDVQFRTMDFRKPDTKEKYDAAYCVFDSVNYLQDADQFLEMLHQCCHLLKPGGVFIFDFVTPVNSMDSAEYLNNEEATSGKFRFYRSSRYDYREKIHYNEFEIEELADNGRTVVNRFREIHKQRIYTLNEILAILKQTSYHLLAKYGDLDFIDANEDCARVTIVLRCQKI